MLGHEPPQPRGQAQGWGARAARALTEPVGEGGDRMGGVVVAGSPEVGQAAGNGQAACVVGGQPQRVGAQLHGGREARVEIDQRHVVDPHRRPAPC